MQEREQRIVVLVRDSQIVEPALSRSQPVRLEPGAGARQLAEQRAAAGPEQRRMPELILGVAEVEPSQQGIAGQLRRAGQIAPAVRLGLRGAQHPALPSLVVAGESIAAGHGIAYEDTFAAVMGKDLRLQVVNVGCGGYGSDQALLRLADALDRLKRPAAAVITFVPIMLSRNLQDYRPRLALRGGALQPVPLADGLFAHLRLRDLVVNEVPYLGERALRESIQLTAAILRETDRTVRSHRAEPLFAVFSVGPRRSLDEHPEGALIRQLFVDQGLPYELIDVDRGDLVPVDGHPDPAAHRHAAVVLEAALRPRLSPAQ